MASNPDQKAGKSMRKFAVEALIGGQVATDAMTKLSQEEQSALLDGVEAALSAARAEALEQAAQLAGKYLQPDGEHFASLIRSLASAPAAPEKPERLLTARCDPRQGAAGHVYLTGESRCECTKALRTAPPAAAVDDEDSWKALSMQSAREYAEDLERYLQLVEACKRLREASSHSPPKGHTCEECEMWQALSDLEKQGGGKS